MYTHKHIYIYIYIYISLHIQNIIFKLKTCVEHDYIALYMSKERVQRRRHVKFYISYTYPILIRSVP